MALTDAKRQANKKWNKKNKELVKYSNYKSYAKGFIKMANKEDLNLIIKIAKETQMENLINEIKNHAQDWAETDYNTFKDDGTILDFNNYSDMEYISEHLTMAQIIDDLDDEKQDEMLKLFIKEFKQAYINKIGNDKYYELIEK